MRPIILFILLAIPILTWMIIIDAVLTWIPSIDRRNPLVVLLRRITQPLLESFRKLVPPQKTGYVDISPMLAILALWILEAILTRIPL